MPQSVAEKRREVENNLRSFVRQAEEMDAKIRAYLSDRDNKPHPRHQEFIKKIQNMRIDPSVSTRYLETLLDNLQWKVYHFSRAWSQLWENSKTARASQGKNSSAETSGQDLESRPRAENSDQPKIYSVDRLWQIQQEKLAGLGHGHNSESENKEAFVQRIKQRYGKLASEKKKDEEIVMTFDKQNRRCTLVVKKFSNSSE